jgi:hypothetical protein
MYRRKFLAQVTVNAAILFLPARKCSEKGKHLPILGRLSPKTLKRLLIPPDSRF